MEMISALLIVTTLLLDFLGGFEAWREKYFLSLKAAGTQ
jgi:hypothetical protein